LLGDPVGPRLADQKQLCEEADFEQALDVTTHSTKRKLALPFGRGPIGNKERLKSGAADIDYVLQIDQDRASAGLDERNQSVTELLGRRASDLTTAYRPAPRPEWRQRAGRKSQAKVAGCVEMLREPPVPYVRFRVRYPAK
jgi:hypothetical protein